MKKIKNSIFKYICLGLLLLITILVIILSYNGFFFFNKGFNDFDYLMMNIIGDAILVGIITHISSKNISTYVSKKEFDRNNKFNIVVNESRNGIINYEIFMALYKNDNAYFAMTESDRKIINYVYELYDCFLNTLSCSGIEKQLFDTMLNIPFFFSCCDDDGIEASLDKIVQKFDSQKRFYNISILKEMLTKKDIKIISQFSKIVLNIRHYTITNLNNTEGCKILIIVDNIVTCKIPCLPNHTYDIFMYYDSEHWIDCVAFSFDYNSKEYAKTISGFKYSNSKKAFKPAKVNLKDYKKN